MTESKRADILAIKRDICHAPEYRKTVLSVHIYEAVLDEGIGSTEGFWKWWGERQERCSSERR
jgi:hypothetical protein